MTNEIDNSFVCNNIRALRRSRGLSQEDLARRCSCTISFIQHIEQGTSGISGTAASVVRVIANALGVSVHTLITGDAAPDPEIVIRDPAASTAYVNELFGGRPLRKLAADIGVPFSTLGALRTGTVHLCDCRFTTVWKLSVYYNVPVEELIF